MFHRPLPALSRAVEVQIAGQRRLYISGTASIDPGGVSAHRGDTDGQINLAMAVVKALLESRRMTWADAARSIAYFKDRADVPSFNAYCRTQRIAGLKTTTEQATLCREELLFEIELDAYTIS